MNQEAVQEAAGPRFPLSLMFLSPAPLLSDINKKLLFLSYFFFFKEGKQTHHMELGDH